MTINEKEEFGTIVKEIRSDLNEVKDKVARLLDLNPEPTWLERSKATHKTIKTILGNLQRGLVRIEVVCGLPVRPGDVMALAILEDLPSADKTLCRVCRKESPILGSSVCFKCSDLG